MCAKGGKAGYGWGSSMCLSVYWAFFHIASMVLGYCFPSSSHEEKVVQSNFGGGKITLPLLGSRNLAISARSRAMAIEKIDRWRCYIAKQ